MKLIVLFALASVALAQEEYVATPYIAGSDKDAEVITNEFTLGEDGSFSANMETSNEIVMSADGQSFPGPEPETGSYSMSGSYSYRTPDGNVVTVEWTADENGYNAVSDAIPKLSEEQQAAIDAAVAAAPVEDVGGEVLL